LEGGVSTCGNAESLPLFSLPSRRKAYIGLDHGVRLPRLKLIFLPKDDSEADRASLEVSRSIERSGENQRPA
jgi:hypothetical protein